MTFPVPTRADVSDDNKAIFDALESKLSMVPTLYATMGHSDNALSSYLALQNAKSSITGKAREVVNLVVSEVNGCAYCLAAHTMIGGMVGFTPEQILEVRGGTASFDAKLDALARLTKAIAEARGHVEPAQVDAFLAAGWSREALVHAIVTIGDKTITNYLHNVTQVPVDFPAAPALTAQAA